MAAGFAAAFDMIFLFRARVVQEVLDSPNPPFSMMQLVDLIPANKVEQYEAILDASQ